MAFDADIHPRSTKELVVIDLATRPVDLGEQGHSPLLADSRWSADLVARGGCRFHVRPAAPTDEGALAEFFAHVDRDDLRFRFLRAVRTVGHDQLQALVKVDHSRAENFLAIEADTGLIIATAMLAADDTMAKAEIAIAIRSDFKRGGISWTLLEHVERFATAKGIKTLESTESRDNLQAIKLEREMGWTSSVCPGEASLVILRKTLQTASA